MKSQFDEIDIVPTDVLYLKDLAYSITGTGWFSEKDLHKIEKTARALMLFNVNAIVNTEKLLEGKVLYICKKGVWLVEVPYDFKGTGIKFKHKYELFLMRKKNKLNVSPMTN